MKLFPDLMADPSRPDIIDDPFSSESDDGIAYNGDESSSESGDDGSSDVARRRREHRLSTMDIVMGILSFFILVYSVIGYALQEELSL